MVSQQSKNYGGSMRSSLKSLFGLAEDIASLDERILEIFIHADSKKDPLSGEEIYLVCHLADPAITNDIAAYDESAVGWSLDMSEAMQHILEKRDIRQEVILTPFNFRLHERGEYGSYYITLFLREGYKPILEIADEQKKEKERQVLASIEGEDYQE